MMTQKMTLDEAVKAVAPHASHDRTLPTLGLVHVVGNVVEATDKYTAARVMLAEGTNLPETFLTIEDIRLGVAGINNEHVIFNNGTRRDQRRETLDYPPLARLFAGFDTSEPGYGPASFIFHPDFASKFAARHFPKWATVKGGILGLTMEFQKKNPSPMRLTISTIDGYEALWVPMAAITK